MTTAAIAVINRYLSRHQQRLHVSGVHGIGILLEALRLFHQKDVHEMTEGPTGK